jgi:hypothetical protein
MTYNIKMMWFSEWKDFKVQIIQHVETEENAKVGRSPKPTFRLFCTSTSFHIKNHIILLLYAVQIHQLYVLQVLDQ